MDVQDKKIILFGGTEGLSYLPYYLEADGDTRVAVEVLSDTHRYNSLREAVTVP